MTREELNNKKQKEIFREENREKRKKLVLISLKIMITIVFLFTAFYFYTTRISAGSIIIKEKRIISEKIPDSFNGTKIIHFSDLHYGSNINYDKLKEIVNLINERKPDLVLFSGDLIAKDYNLSNKEQEKVINELKKITANLGKYTVMGDEDKDNFTTIMNQSDFTILNNDYDFLYNKTNDAILLIGFASSLNKQMDIDKGLEYFSNETANHDIYTISLFHEPDSAEDILNKHNVNLLLAGHSHNGNIRIPYIGSIIKIDGARKYDQEYYKINNSELYISSGLGTTGDGIRLFCRPSINFFRISNF